MLPYDTCSADIFPKIGELVPPPVYLSKPKLHQPELIPPQLRAECDRRWLQKRFTLPPIRFFHLKDVYVAQHGIVFTADGRLITESITNHSHEEIAKGFEALTTALACRSDIPHVAKGVLCKKRGAENYGHWLVEMLPKAFLAMRHLQLGHDWPAIAYSAGDAMNNVVRDSLRLIDYPADEVVFTGTSPCHFDELILIDGLTVHSVFMSTPVFECMEKIAGAVPAGPAESLYVTRRPSISRCFENEAEIQAVFSEFGFREIECAQLSFAEQVSAFKSARQIAGPMGAAFTNAIFCQPDTRWLLFMPASAHEYFFWQIAEGKKIEYHEIRTQETGALRGSLPWDRNMYISPSDVRDMLIRLAECSC